MEFGLDSAEHLYSAPQSLKQPQQPPDGVAENTVPAMSVLEQMHDIVFYVLLKVTIKSDERSEVGIAGAMKVHLQEGVLAQKFWRRAALPPSAPSSPSPFSPFSETEKIRTSCRPTFEIYH